MSAGRAAIGVIGFGAISALGRGADAVRVATDREVTRVARDEELTAAGLKRPYCARANLEGDGGGDRAARLLSIAIDDCLRAVGPEWLERRIGLAVGTSSGGMRAFMAAEGADLREVASARAGVAGAGAVVTPLDRTYAGPVAVAVKRAFAPASVVLAACASSAIAIGLGCAWLEADRCDLVLAGGFDAVSVFVAAGFECLRATCGERGPRPFRKDRDGLALGEGAAMVALARSPRVARAWITGFGASCDAHHLTSPAPDGAGLARAARAACAAAGVGMERVDLISAHGTATSQNDAAEAKTIASLGLEAPAFSFKGTLGHTLGAAGALETLATIDALERAVAPSTAGEGPVEEGVVLHDHAEALAPAKAEGATALKLASAFGGANAALVLTLTRPRDDISGRDSVSGRDGVSVRDSVSPRDSVSAPAPVAISRAVQVSPDDIEPALAARSGYPVDRVARADDLVRWALAAVAALRERVGDLRGAGIVTGLGLATIETNAKFLARIARPEPRRFPYTTPNAAAGECAVAFGLDGPALAVGGGPHGGLEAICVAADLVRAGVAERIVVVAADEAAGASEMIAPGTKSGAIALLVGRDDGTRASAHLEARLTDWNVTYEPYEPNEPARVSTLPPMHAHAALLPLVAGEPPLLCADVPWGGRAQIHLAWREPKE